MVTKDLQTLRAKFLKEFAAVPAPIRDEIVAIVDGQTYTWATAYLEISQETDLGDRILKTLNLLKII